jgi:antitoxin VapB
MCIHYVYPFITAGGAMNTAKIFRSGNSQAVRLPKDFQFDVSEVEIYRRGDEVVLRKKLQNLSRVFDLLTDMSADFMEDGRNQPPMQEREPF